MFLRAAKLEYKKRRRKKSSIQGFQFIAGNLALDFVNTVGNRSGNPREYLESADELRRWARLAGLLPNHASLPIRKGQLERIRAMREELHRLFRQLAFGASPPGDMVGLLNRRFAALAHKRQVSRDREGWKWNWVTSIHDPDRVLAPVLLSAMDLLVSGLSPRLRQCEDETCGWLFVDRSQGGRRRWCSMADCGNRAKARRFQLRNPKNLKIQP